MCRVGRHGKKLLQFSVCRQQISRFVFVGHLNVVSNTRRGLRCYRMRLPVRPDRVPLLLRYYPERIRSYRIVEAPTMCSTGHTTHSEGLALAAAICYPCLTFALSDLTSTPPSNQPTHS